MQTLIAAGLGIHPMTIDVPDVRVPQALGWPRCNRIIGNGSWDIPEDERTMIFG